MPMMLSMSSMEKSCWVKGEIFKYFSFCIVTNVYNSRVVVEPARGTARGSHRDRNDDRYGRRGGGGRYDK